MYVSLLSVSLILFKLIKEYVLERHRECSKSVDITFSHIYEKKYISEGEIENFKCSCHKYKV